MKENVKLVLAAIAFLVIWFILWNLTADCKQERTWESNFIAQKDSLEKKLWETYKETNASKEEISKLDDKEKIEKLVEVSKWKDLELCNSFEWKHRVLCKQSMINNKIQETKDLKFCFLNNEVETWSWFEVSKIEPENCIINNLNMLWLNEKQKTDACSLITETNKQKECLTAF